MLSNVEYLKRSLEQCREVIVASLQSERARDGAKPKGPYDDDQDVQMYGDSMKQSYGMTEVKKRRGVSLALLFVASRKPSVLICYSVLLLLADATAAIVSIPRNGDVALMVPGHSAMLAAFITPN